MNQECCDGQVENIFNESKCGYEICRAYGLKFYYNPKEYKCISKSGKDTFERIGSIVSPDLFSVPGKFYFTFII
jgi:hypothetical protein